MRYRSRRAAEGGGSRPLALLRGPKSARTVLATTVAGAIGLVPALVAAPAMASPDSNLTLSVSSAVTEGGNLTFTLTTGGAGTYDITTAPVVTASSPGAVSGTDYTALTTPQQQLVFSGAGTQTVVVHTTDDSLYEGSRQFTLTATNHDGMSGDQSAVGTINDNDAAPSYTLSATPSTVLEPAALAATTTTTVAAKLSAISGVATTITLSSSDISAKAGTNYTALSSPTIVIPAGQLTGNTVAVTVKGDGVKDVSDTMSFSVSGLADNALPTVATTTVNITDAQSTPKLVLSGGGNATEGSNVTFTVTATPASQLPITFKWDAVEVTPATNHDKATPGSDFTYPDYRTVTIAPNTTTATLTVPLINDGLNENTEDFAVKISNPTNASLGDTVQVPASITDANSAATPTVAISPAAVTEGDYGTKTQTFTATLSQPSGRTVKVDWATANDNVSGVGHAVAGQDYVTNSGHLVFPAGTTTQTFTVDIIGDTIDEGTGETFTVNLTAPAGDTSANLGTGSASVTITDDDATPTATLDDLSVKEGDSANALLMPIKLSNASDHDITYTVADTTSGNQGTASNTLSATPGTGDYTLLNTSVTIPAGLTAGYVVVLDNGDMMYEPDETAYFTASTGSIYVATATKTAKLTLQNDDNPPNLEINSIKGKEGDTLSITGTVTGISQSATTMTVWFAGESVKGSKAADEKDFINPGVVTVNVPAGTMPGAVLPVAQVTLNDDSWPEPAETVIASGNGVGNVGTVTDGVITILPSDGGENPPPPKAPTISAPASVTGGTTVAITGKADPGATVDLYGAPWLPADEKLSKMTSTTAGKDGSFKFAPWIGTGYRFAVAVGDQWSDDVKVRVNQAPLLVASSPAKGKLSVAVQGNPRDSKQAVTVQVYKSGKWVNTWHGSTGSDKLWKATVSEKSKSSWTLRAYVAGDAASGVNGGYSAIKKVMIK